MCLPQMTIPVASYDLHSCSGHILSFPQYPQGAQHHDTVNNTSNVSMLYTQYYDMLGDFNNDLVNNTIINSA